MVSSIAASDDSRPIFILLMAKSRGTISGESLYVTYMKQPANTPKSMGIKYQSGDGLFWYMYDMYDARYN